jgi:hypothetical protein
MTPAEQDRPLGVVDARIDSALRRGDVLAVDQR